MAAPAVTPAAQGAAAAVLAAQTRQRLAAIRTAAEATEKARRQNQAAK